MVCIPHFSHIHTQRKRLGEMVEVLDVAQWWQWSFRVFSVWMHPNQITSLSLSLHYRPQLKLREGNVFTPVCDSVHGGSLCPRASLSGGSLSMGVTIRETSTPHGKERAVRIPLECILVPIFVRREQAFTGFFLNSEVKINVPQLRWFLQLSQLRNPTPNWHSSSPHPPSEIITRRRLLKDSLWESQLPRYSKRNIITKEYF